MNTTIVKELTGIIESLFPKVEYLEGLSVAEELELFCRRSPQIKTSITNGRYIEVWCMYEGLEGIVGDRILDKAQEFRSRGIEEAWIYFGGRKTKLYL